MRSMRCIEKVGLVLKLKIMELGINRPMIQMQPLSLESMHLK